LGHLTRKNPIPDMTYNVFGEMLNRTQSNPQAVYSVSPITDSYQLTTLKYTLVLTIP